MEFEFLMYESACS